MKKLACVLALLSGLGCSRARPLTVGSKNFTEQIVLGEIVAQQLERRLGGKVDRKLDLGGTLLAQQALRNGEIDLYPEYTGTALTAVLKLAPLSDPAAVLERVRAEYRKRWRLEWLDPPRHRSMQNNSMQRSTLPVWKGSPEGVEGQTDIGEEKPQVET